MINGKDKQDESISAFRKISDEDIQRMLASDHLEDLLLLSLRVGEYFQKWKKAQDICIHLATHPNEEVRVNAALGLAYIARTKGKLEKHMVKPVLLELLDNCIAFRWRIIDSLEDINFYLDWHIGEKALRNK